MFDFRDRGKSAVDELKDMIAFAEWFDHKKKRTVDEAKKKEKESEKKKKFSIPTVDGLILGMIIGPIIGFGGLWFVLSMVESMMEKMQRLPITTP